MHDKILTMKNLRRRGTSITNRCYLCKEENESIVHLFLECTYTLKVWSYIWNKFWLVWVMNKDMEQFVDNWSCPFYHPHRRVLWNLLPPHVCWGVWKERNNWVFREEERGEEVVGEILGKLVMDNVMVAKFRVPQEPPSRKEKDIVGRWNILLDFHKFDNLKRVARKNTRWIPPTGSTVKLNFNAVARRG